METNLDQKGILDRVLKDKESHLYLSKNSKKIYKFLKEKGLEIPEKIIKSYVLSHKTAPIVYKNRSENKISQISKPFIGRQRFFYSIHGDILVLSKNRSYLTNQYNILLICDSLSNTIYLERLKSTRHDFVIAALEKIFDRCEYLPQKGSVLTYDHGVEIQSKSLLAWLTGHGMKLNVIKPRGDRGSKGSGIAETHVRRVRERLETYYSNEKRITPLHKVLPIIERLLNTEPLSVFDGLSSKQALTHDPRYISMLKHSARFRRSKLLREQMMEETQLPLYSIVRIVKFTKKLKFTKESYGSLSGQMFIIISREKLDFTTYYTLGSLFSLLPVFDCKFSRLELVQIDISYPLAVYREAVSNPGVIVGSGDGMVQFRPPNSKHVFIATELMFK